MEYAATHEQVAAWLGRKILKQVVLQILGGLAALFRGAAVVYATFWIIYGVTWFILRSFDVGSGVLTIIAGAVVLLLFLANARTDRRYLEKVSVTTGTFSDQVVTFYLPGVGMVSNINPLAPDTVHTGAKLITSCLRGLWSLGSERI